MKVHKVYELIDQTSKIIDVGYTGGSLKRRLWEHLSRGGRWSNRTDLEIRTHSVHPDLKTALRAEGARKLELGFTWSEQDARVKGGKKNVENGRMSIMGKIGGAKAGKISGPISTAIEYTCKCGRIIKGPSYHMHLKACKKIRMMNDRDSSN